MTKHLKIFLILAVSLTSCLGIGCQTPSEPPIATEQASAPKENSVAKESPAPKEGAAPASNPYYSHTDTAPLNVPDSEWKKILPADVYAVARKKDTEAPFTGKYNDFKGIGTYYCVVCGNKLFRSDAKFASACGWPSFFEPSRKDAVIYETDKSLGMVREEVMCGRCKSHLGHVFDDGPPPTGKRFCMNSIVLDFVPDTPASKDKS